MTSDELPAAAGDPSAAQLQNLLAVLSAELREDPDDLTLRLKLAETLRMLGRTREAISFYSNVAWSHAIAGNLPQAIAQCKLILELEPEHRETQHMLAKLYANERVREAKRSLAVERVGGRWVLDPRRQRTDHGEPPPPASLASTDPPLTAGGHDQAAAPTTAEPADAEPPQQPLGVGAPASAPLADQLTSPEVPAALDRAAHPRAELRPARRATRPFDPVPRREPPPSTGPRPAATQPPGVPAPPAVAATLPPAAADDDRRQPRRAPRLTTPMPDASLNTLLRQDAELCFMQNEARVTECQAAIQREVVARGKAQQDVPPAPDVQRRIVDELRDTLRDPAVQDTERDLGRPLPIAPLFSALDTAAFMALIERLERRCYTAGSLVFAEGEEGDSLMLVSVGHLQVFKQDAGERIELARLGPGSFFGEFGLLADQRRHASVRCLDDCELLELRKEVLAELTRVHPTVASTLRRFYEERVLDMVLTTSPLFRLLSPEDREQVLARFAPRRFAAQEQIIAEGGPSCFYVVLLGEVVVSCKADAGEELVLGTLTEGDYFGEMALISGRPAEATVRAARATETLTLDARDFYELAAAHPEIWAELQRESRNRQQLNARLLAAWKAGALLL